MRRRMKAIILAALFVCVAGGSVWRISALNKEFSSYNQEIIYEVGQTVPYDGLEIYVDSFEIADQEEVISKFNLEKDGLSLDMTPQKVLFAKIHIKNTTEETKRINIFNFTVESGALSNAPAIDYMMQMNAEPASRPEIAPGEEYEEWIAATFIESMLRTPKDWENLADRDFLLVISVNPKKVALKLN